MASWAVLEEQKVRITPRVTAFTVLCEACVQLGVTFPSVEGRLELEARRGTIECPRGHRLRVEREAR